MSSRIYKMSSAVITLPRYLKIAIEQQYEPVFLGTQEGSFVFYKNLYFRALTRRHIGAARTRDTSPAASSNCAS